MSITAEQETERRRSALDERVRVAWMTYRETLRDLGGDEYAVTEPVAWDMLQHELHEISSERETIETILALSGTDEG